MRPVLSSGASGRGAAARVLAWNVLGPCLAFSVLSLVNDITNHGMGAIRTGEAACAVRPGPCGRGVRAQRPIMSVMFGWGVVVPFKGPGWPVGERTIGLAVTDLH